MTFLPHTQQIADLVHVGKRLKIAEQKSRQREESDATKIKSMSEKISELNQQVSNLLMRSDAAETEAEQAKRAVKQAEKKTKKMSKTLESVKLCLKNQRDDNAEHKRMCLEFPKIKKERDKAREDVTRLTERVVAAERETEQANQALKKAERKTDNMSASLKAVQLCLKNQRQGNAEQKRMFVEFPKVERERDKAREDVVRLTERVATVEREAEQANQALKQQLVDMTKRARDAKKEVISLTKSRDMAEKLCTKLRCGQATYRQLQNMILERDNALIKVTQLQERLEIKSRELQGAQKDMRSARETAQRAQDVEQKLRDFEKEQILNSKKHKWMLVASALGMDGTQSKRIQYLLKHMHDTKSEDWKHSLIKKSDLTTRLPTAVRLLLEELFSCVRVKKKTVPVTDILRHVYKQEIFNELQTDTALKEIRNAVRSAVRIVVECLFEIYVCVRVHSATNTHTITPHTHTY